MPYSKLSENWKQERNCWSSAPRLSEPGLLLSSFMLQTQKLLRACRISMKLWINSISLDFWDRRSLKLNWYCSSLQSPQMLFWFRRRMSGSWGFNNLTRLFLWIICKFLNLLYDLNITVYYYFLMMDFSITWDFRVAGYRYTKFGKKNQVFLTAGYERIVSSIQSVIDIISFLVTRDDRIW